ncbi:hypothetical protein [Aquibacillus sediminis]|uniref:hypothetical protein n=1 Tax=Aquibacillus sediminis TaxID=2574734 RepID=UPI00110891BD|nr:hypothetical protein [Aquibacillus sediminis]
MRRVKLFIFILFILFIINWTGIFSSSIEETVEKNGWDNIFLTEMLDSKTAMVFMEEKKGEISFNFAYKGIFGWRLDDSSGRLFSVNDNVEGFSTSEVPIIVDGDVLYYCLMGIVMDEEIDDIAYKSSEVNNERTLNRFTTNKGTRIYYTVVERELSDVSYIAYNSLDEILYNKQRNFL